MASQKKRRKDYLESSGVPVIFVSSEKGNPKAVTTIADSIQCYTWSKMGKSDRRKDKTEIHTYVCSTCRALNAKAPHNYDLPTKKLIKFQDGHAEWVSREYHDQHLRDCVPHDGDQVLAEGMVQEQINTISAGILKCTASVAVKGVETKLTQLYSDQGPVRLNAIRDHVKGSQVAITKRFQRATNRRYKRMSNFSTIMKDQFQKYRYTLRSEKIVDPANGFFEEKLLIFTNVFAFFSLFDLPPEAPKTTNVAESYHSHLAHHFRTKKSTLGTWITDFRDLQNSEVLICEDVIRGKEIPPHLREEYRMNAIQIQEAKRQLEDEDLEGIFDDSHNSSMESVNTAKLGQYLVVVGAHMGNSGNNKRRIAENGTEDPEISDNPSDDENNENDDEYDGLLNWDYRGFESSLDFEESDSQDEDS